jgi:phosphate starvation-inducible PhoH-like protein
MIEKIIYLEGVDPVRLLGVNNSRLGKMTKIFPGLRIVSRGEQIKVKGEEKELESFERAISQMIDYLQQTEDINENYIDELLEGTGEEYISGEAKTGDVLLYGNNGKPIRAKTINQKKLVKESSRNDLVFAIGPAGTGKTYTAIALAVKALKYREVKKIILTRPAVEAGERLGFLPGDYKEKLDPYMQPLYDALDDMIPSKKLKSFLEDGTIQIAPLAFMRGRTLGNAFVILDEAQNATLNQFKMFLTRMGQHARFIVTGDITQIDLPSPDHSGLLQGISLLKNVDGISMVYFDSRDIIRHRLVRYIVEAYQKKDDKSKKNK